MHDLPGLVPEFATTSEQVVFGRDLAGWHWLGRGVGSAEHVHVYRLPGWDLWALLPVSTEYSISADPQTEYGLQKYSSFDGAHPLGRQMIARYASWGLEFGPSFERLLTKSLRHITEWPYARCGPLPWAAQWHRRVQGISSFAATETEQAVAVLAALQAAAHPYR